MYRSKRKEDESSVAAVGLTTKTWYGRAISHKVLTFQSDILRDLFTDGWRKEGDTRASRWLEDFYSQENLRLFLVLDIDKAAGTFHVSLAKRMDKVEKFMAHAKKRRAKR